MQLSHIPPLFHTLSPDPREKHSCTLFIIATAKVLRHGFCYMMDVNYYERLDCHTSLAVCRTSMLTLCALLGGWIAGLNLRTTCSWKHLGTSEVSDMNGPFRRSERYPISTNPINTDPRSSRHKDSTLDQFAEHFRQGRVRITRGSILSVSRRLDACHHSGKWMKPWISRAAAFMASFGPMSRWASVRCFRRQPCRKTLVVILHQKCFYEIKWTAWGAFSANCMKDVVRSRRFFGHGHTLSLSAALNPGTLPFVHRWQMRLY